MEADGIGELRWLRAGSRAELPLDGGGRTVELEGRRVALFLHAGEVRAVEDSCPHMGASLGMGVALDGEVTCPWHGWHFRLTDGCNTDGLDARVAVHPVRQLPDGSLEVGLPAAGSAQA